jgi:hypothetical protein
VSLFYEFLLLLLCCKSCIAVNIRRESTAEASIGRNQDNAKITHRTLLQQRQLVLEIVTTGIRKARGKIAQLLGVRASLFYALLYAAHLTTGYHLHGLGDLGHVFGTSDALSDFSE